MFYRFTYADTPAPEAYYSMAIVGQVDPVCLYQAVPLAGERPLAWERQILKENRQQNIDISQIEIRQRTFRRTESFKYRKSFIIIHLLGGPGLVVNAGAAGAAGAGGLLVPGGGGGAPDPEREQNI